MSNYMKKYGFRAWPLYELGGGGSSRDSQIFPTVKKYSEFANEIRIYLTN